MASSATQFKPGVSEEKVKQDELKLIDVRRKRAFSGCQSPAAAPENLVGVALSGGGIRSAMFNRGLLQAFSHRGLLRYVDYLSSVSGGGYIAGWLGMTAVSAQAEVAQRESQPKPIDGSEGLDEQNGSRAGSVSDAGIEELANDPRACFHDNPAADLGTDPTTGQQFDRASGESHSSEDYSFQRAGEMLELFRFIPRYVGYTFPVTLLWLAFWGLIATSVALFWRSFDHPYTFRFYFNLLGFNDIANELLVAFLPAILMGVAWLILRAVVVLIERRFWIQKLAVVVSVSLLLVFTGPLLLLSFTVFGEPVIDGDATIFRIAELLKLLFGFLWAALVGLFLGSVLMSAFPGRLGAFSRWMEGAGAQLVRKFATTAFWLTVAASGVSLAVFLGNGYTRASADGRDLRLNHLIAYLSFAGAILQIIPLLGRGSLVQSARESARPWQRWMLGTLSWACLLVPAFAVVHWMAREDISGFAAKRGPELLPKDIISWRSFEQLAINRLDVTPDASSLTAAELQLTKNELELRGIENIESPSWANYLRRPLLTLNGTLSTWWLILGGDHDTSVDLKHYRNSFAKFHGDREEYLQRFNKQLESWALTGPLVGELTDLADEYRDPRNKADEYAPIEKLFTAIAVPLQPSRSSGVAASQESRAAESGEGAGNRADHGSPIDSSAASRVLARRMEYMEDWDANDRKDFWITWSHFLALLPQRDPLAEGAVAHLIASGDASEPEADRFWNKHEIAHFNRQLLELLYPHIIRERSMVSTEIVPLMDQRTRWSWMLFWLVLCVVLFLYVDANRDSAFFRYYSERLSDYYLREKLKENSGRALRKKLHEFTPWECGMPYQLFSAALMVQPGNYRDRYFEPFLFSSQYCGNGHTGYVETKWFTMKDYPVELADAIAVSGAAVTPLMTANTALRVVMRVFNFSLGAFVPNPALVQACRGAKGFSTSLSHALWESLKGRFGPTRDWKLAFVADGGFREYLGAEELLRRKCRLIIVSDAGCNEGRDEFSALAAFVRLARIEHGIELLDLDHDRPLCLDRFRRQRLEDPSPQQYLCARIRYPADDLSNSETTNEGLLVYLHMALTGKEEIDLQQFRKQHPEFPYDSTSNQFFTPNQVESYRQLGYYIGSLVCRQLPAWRDAPQWKAPSRRMEIDELLYRLQLGYLEECLLERSYDAVDISPEALYQADLERLSLSWSELDAKCSADAALQRYHKDANFRLAWRSALAHGPERFKTQIIRRLANDQSTNRTPLTSSDAVREWWCDEANLALAFTICNDLVITRGGTLFQVGGRARLLAMAKPWKDRINRDVVLDKFGYLSMHQFTADLAGALQHVFCTGAEATAKMFVSFLVCDEETGEGRAGENESMPMSTPPTERPSESFQID